MKRGEKKRAQISMEYMMIIGFVTFIISLILGIAFFYLNGIQDKTNSGHITQFAEKIIATSQQIFYAGEPSKATIEVYLPDTVDTVLIQDNTIYITYTSSTGQNTVGFESQINITGSLPATQGIKRISLTALNGQVVVAEV